MYKSLPKNCIYIIIKNLTFYDYLNLRQIPNWCQKITSKDFSSLLLKERYGVIDYDDVIDVEKRFKSVYYYESMSSAYGTRWSPKRIDEIKEECLTLGLTKEDIDQYYNNNLSENFCRINGELSEHLRFYMDHVMILRNLSKFGPWFLSKFFIKNSKLLSNNIVLNEMLTKKKTDIISEIDKALINMANCEDCVIDLLEHISDDQILYLIDYMRLSFMLDNLKFVCKNERHSNKIANKILKYCKSPFENAKYASISLRILLENNMFSSIMLPNWAINSNNLIFSKKRRLITHSSHMSIRVKR